MTTEGNPPLKRRLDLAVVEAGLAESRARAQAMIMGGGISVNGTVATKPGSAVLASAVIELVTQPLPYVSRGGLKLRHALDHFDVPVLGAIAADVGASTGGFTDVLLQAGATRVYAIDVGYGQLAWQLRTDDRVVVMERTNVRYLEGLPEVLDLGVVDVSFISLRLILPPLGRLVRSHGDAICLIKPQFEAGRGQVGRNGVVRDPAVWREVLQRVLIGAQLQGWSVRGLERSPIQGPAGNVEFLSHLSHLPSAAGIDVAEAIERVIQRE